MKAIKYITVCLSILLYIFYFNGYAGSSSFASVEKASLSGHWEGSWQYTDGSYVEKFSFDLIESGGIITGKGVDEKGIAAKVTGVNKDSLFTLKIVPEDGNPPILFSGQLDKNTIRGTWIVGRSSGPWSAVKK